MLENSSSGFKSFGVSLSTRALVSWLPQVSSFLHSVYRAASLLALRFPSRRCPSWSMTQRVPVVALGLTKPARALDQATGWGALKTYWVLTLWFGVGETIFLRSGP